MDGCPWVSWKDTAYGRGQQAPFWPDFYTPSGFDPRSGSNRSYGSVLVSTCRRAFEERHGLAVGDWPVDVTEGPLRERYLDFRRGNISRLVEAVSRGARAIRPGVKVSAAVFWNLPTDRDRIGQDWGMWLEKGWLDFVCPMTYTPDARA